jgi:hypothetical protein
VSTTDNTTIPAEWRYEQAMLKRLVVEPEFQAHKDAWHNAMKRKDVAVALEHFEPVRKWLDLTKLIEPAQAEIVAQASMAMCQHAYELLQRHPAAWTADALMSQRAPRRGTFMYRLRVYAIPVALVVATALTHPAWLWGVIPTAVLFGRWQDRLMREQIYADLAHQKARVGTLPDDAQRLRHEFGLHDVRAISYGLVIDLAKRYHAVLVERAAAEKAAQAARRQVVSAAQVTTPGRVSGVALGTGLAAAAGAGLAMAAYPAQVHYQQENPPAIQDLSPVQDFDYDFDTAWQPEPLDPYGDINPASGLPMVGGGSPIDVGGNVFGTDDLFN